MTFGERVRIRRVELNMTRGDLAALLGLSVSAISNYENGVSFPKEEIMLRLFDCLEIDPNTLFQDSFRTNREPLSQKERHLLQGYRDLSPLGQQTLQSLVDALCAYRDDERTRPLPPAPKVIPLYRSPAAAGYAAPAFGEDFDYITVEEGIPPAAEFAVRIQGDSMLPVIEDGSVVYVNRAPLKAGDVGIFCVDGDIFCKQYYRDPAGFVYLFSLNRARADADIMFAPSSGRTLVCFGRVILEQTIPLPGRGRE